MNNPGRILSISDDDGLRQSRELLLLTYGFDVTSISSETPLSVVEARTFPYALICRSIDSKRVTPLVEMLRGYNPEIKILRITTLDGDDLCHPDYNIPSTPESLLERLRYICSSRMEMRGYPMV